MNYTSLPKEGVKTDPNTRLHTSNPNLGDILWDKNVPRTGNHYTSECQEHQYGKDTTYGIDIRTISSR